MAGELIIPHHNADLDALGAAVAAQVLYPRAQIVFPGMLQPGAAEFFTLHRQMLQSLSLREVNAAAVERVVVVDTAEADRLGELAPLLARPGVRLHIYDHHPRQPGDLTGELEVWAEVGATCTLFTELLAEARAALSPFQATALLLGIYADTGSLRLLSTTARDVQAAAWLLEQGASLRVVDRFCHPELTPAQQELLAQLLATARTERFGKAKVRIAPGLSAHYIPGLSHVVHKLLELQPAPATFVLVQMADRVHVIGRSEVAWVNCAAVLSPMGGGGHAGAAAAAVKGAALSDVLEQLRTVLHANVGRPVTAQDLMTAPVRAVPPDMTIAEAEGLMLRYGHSGLVVVDGDAVEGVITRRDVEKARRHDLTHAPVKGMMSRPVVSIAPGTPVDELLALMVAHRIGRLPVLEHGRLVGIVTRSDVLGQLYGTALPHWHQTLYTAGVAPDAAATQAEMMYRAAALPPAGAGVLKAAGAVARETAVPAYAVGGFVRDLLLGHPTLDIDLVVEGDGLAFARLLATQLGGVVEEVPRFGTAHITMPDGRRVDVATARREFYEYAAALPRVEHADLRDDLYRRDFTINAMAVRLTPAGLGDLVDFFGGYQDLRAGRIRVLHSLSFVEDPTRILRGIRFAGRYRFTLEPETERLARAAVAGGFLERVSAERLRNELLLVATEARAPEIWESMAEGGILERVLPEVTWSREVARLLRAARRFLRGQGLPPGAQPLRRETRPQWLYLLVLGSSAADAGVPAYIDRLKLDRAGRQVLHQALEKWRATLAVLKEPHLPASRVDEALAGWSPTGLALLWLRGRGGPAPRRVEAYWNEYRKVRSRVTGADLRAAGLPPGPAYSRALAAARRARLDGLVQTREQELSLALLTARSVLSMAAGTAPGAAAGDSDPAGDGKGGGE